MRDLEGKTVVVTGSASGMGLASVMRFLAEGARVVIADYNSETGESALEAAGDAGFADAVSFLRTDVAREESVVSVLDHATERFGRLDVVFNNAGILSPGTLPDLAPDDWHRVIDVDLHSVYYGCRAAISHMRTSGGGAIVNLASVSGLAGDYAMPYRPRSTFSRPPVSAGGGLQDLEHGGAVGKRHDRTVGEAPR